MFGEIFVFHFGEGLELVLDALTGDIVFVDLPEVGISDAAEVPLVELGDADTDCVVVCVEDDSIVERVIDGDVCDDAVDGRGSFAVDIVVALRGAELHALEGREHIGLDVLEELLVEVYDVL